MGEAPMRNRNSWRSWGAGPHGRGASAVTGGTREPSWRARKCRASPGGASNTTPSGYGLGFENRL